MWNTPVAHRLATVKPPNNGHAQDPAFLSGCPPIFVWSVYKLYIVIGVSFIYFHFTSNISSSAYTCNVMVLPHGLYNNVSHMYKWYNNNYHRIGLTVELGE